MQINKAEIQEILPEILNLEIDEIIQLGGGRNSLAFKINCSTSQYFVSKFYFRHEKDTRDRLSTEFNSLRFLWDHGMRCIPEPLILNREYECGVYEWVKGKKILIQDVGESEIDQAVSFLLTLKKLSSLKESQKLQPASEACFSIETVFRTIEQRISLLDKVQDHDLRLFLRDEIKPVFSKVLDWCRKECNALEYNWHDNIALKERTLSASDFGFHNAIMLDIGEIVFLDFEYFGWDDPAKMISDFLWHPAFKLSSDLKKYFVQKMLKLFPSSEQLRQRIRITFPLHGINWSLRMLNEFLPEHSLRRQFASWKNFQIKNIHNKQLNKAGKLIEKISKGYKKFPYE